MPRFLWRYVVKWSNLSSDEILSISRVTGSRSGPDWLLSQCVCGDLLPMMLTHWGRVTHISVGNLTIIGSDDGLSPGRRQAITWTNIGILLIGPLGTNFSEMLIEIHPFSFRKIHLKISSGKWRPYCLGLNALNRNLQNFGHMCDKPKAIPTDANMVIKPGLRNWTCWNYRS